VAFRGYNSPAPRRSMLKNFKFFSLAYLNDWWQYDRNFVSGLRPKASSRRESLVKAATYYQVIRLFPKNKDKVDRLDNALNNLDAVLKGVSNIITPANVDLTVTTLATTLGLTYKRKSGKAAELISSASKFLWIRRQSPVIIFDQRAHACLKMMKATPGTTYATFRKAWLTEFQTYESQIRSACRGLSSSGVKDFAPDSKGRSGAKSLLRQRWFHERVFDKFLWWNGG
jgi:hypothetical protein